MMMMKEEKQEEKGTPPHAHAETHWQHPKKNFYPLALHFALSLCMKSHSQLRRALCVKREGINKQANGGMHMTLCALLMSKKTAFTTETDRHLAELYYVPFLHKRRASSKQAACGRK